MRTAHRVLILLLTLLLSATVASALSFNLSDPNGAISPYSGPYANVTITVTNATTALVSVQALGSYFMGGNSILALNLLGGNTVQVTANDFSSSYLSQNIPNNGKIPVNVSDFGAFVLDVDGDNMSHTFTTFSFTMHNNNAGITWTDGNIMVNNAEGYYAVGHIYIPTATGALAVTGYAGNGAPVPEPTTLMLLGTGLIGLAGFRRTSKK